MVAALTRLSQSVAVTFPTIELRTSVLLIYKCQQRFVTMLYEASCSQNLREPNVEDLKQTQKWDANFRFPGFCALLIAQVGSCIVQPRLSNNKRLKSFVCLKVDLGV